MPDSYTSRPSSATKGIRSGASRTSGPSGVSCVSRPTSRDQGESNSIASYFPNHAHLQPALPSLHQPGGPSRTPSGPFAYSHPTSLNSTTISPRPDQERLVRHTSTGTTSAHGASHFRPWGSHSNAHQSTDSSKFTKHKPASPKINHINDRRGFQSHKRTKASAEMSSTHVVISDDDEPLRRKTKTRPSVFRSQSLRESRSSETLKADSDEDQEEEEARSVEENNFIDDEEKLSEARFQEVLDPLNVRATIQATIQGHLHDVTEVPKDLLARKGIKCKIGDTVELDSKDFLRVQRILLGNNDKCFIEGQLFRENTRVGGLVPPKKDEVCWIVKLTPDEHTQGITRKDERYTFEQVKGVRSLHLTNSHYPRTETDTLEQTAADGFRRLFFARYKFIDVRESGAKKATETAIIRLTAAEADEDYKEDPECQRVAWRGDTIPHGGHEHNCIDVDNLAAKLEETHIKATTSSSSNPRSYSFGDAFCGCGGVSWGAPRAGLYIKWAFDKDENAAKSYHANFSQQGAQCEHADCSSFLTGLSEFLKVDVLHMSPPCQFFSWAKTMAGKNDDANEAAIYVVPDMLQKCKPRIATMEETDGLISISKHILTFHRTLSNIVEAGYSVRWGVLNFKDYGVPANRKRLIIIAAGPGEELPPLPKATHGPGSGTGRSYKSIGDAIFDIQPGDLLHTSRYDLSQALPVSAFVPGNIAKCLTQAGGQNKHPNGRPFTNREYARLQTFPDNMELKRGGKNEENKAALGIRAQIGNAVPPRFSEQLMRSVIKSLKKVDKGRAAASRTRP